jgi:hypothetical protein
MLFIFARVLPCPCLRPSLLRRFPTIDMDTSSSLSASVDIGAVSELIWSMAEKGFNLEQEFLALQQTLRAPLEVLNSSAIQRCTRFFVEVRALWSQIESFGLESNGHLAFAISPFDLAGQGEIKARLPKRKVYVSQALSRRQRSGSGVEAEYMLLLIKSFMSPTQCWELANQGLAVLGCLLQLWTAS